MHTKLTRTLTNVNMPSTTNASVDSDGDETKQDITQDSWNRS
jgi:hypothetical protein